jgi:hypothetical protein
LLAGGPDPLSALFRSETQRELIEPAGIESISGGSMARPVDEVIALSGRKRSEM